MEHETNIHIIHVDREKNRWRNRDRDRWINRDRDRWINRNLIIILYIDKQVYKKQMCVVLEYA